MVNLLFDARARSHTLRIGDSSGGANWPGRSLVSARAQGMGAMSEAARCGMPFVFGLVAAMVWPAPAGAAEPAKVTVRLETPLAPPGWALLERELLRANARACEEFFARYFDDRGFLECVERWGGDDGPDDAIENVNDWPVLYALGGADSILTLFKKAWEGHLRQYTKAKTTDVPFARDGMYFKEFPVMFDWLHHGEGLTVFNMEGLCDPHDPRYRQRVTRFAGFYLNDDPGAPNYDPKVKIIRSLFNGSRGPLLRKATALDWAGDPIEVEHRFQPGSWRAKLSRKCSSISAIITTLSATAR